MHEEEGRYSSWDIGMLCCGFGTFSLDLSNLWESCIRECTNHVFFFNVRVMSVTAPYKQPV